MHLARRSKTSTLTITKYSEVKIKDLNKWRDMLSTCMGKLSIVKMSVLYKLIYRFMAIPISIPAGIFVDIDKIILTV